MEDWDGESLLEAPELPLEVRQNPISMYSLRKGRFYIDSTSTLPVITSNVVHQVPLDGKMLDSSLFFAGGSLYPEFSS